jgi:ERCC4-type nuclease
MKVIVDEREHDLYDKLDILMGMQTRAGCVDLSKEVLPIGDVLIQTNEGKDVLIIERKTFADLLSSIKDGRYEEQSYRLLNSSGFPPHSVFYLLEGMFSQLRTGIESKIIYSAMTSLQFFKGFSVHRAATVNESAEWILHMAEKIGREFSKGRIPYYLTNAYLGNLHKSTNGEHASRPQNVLYPFSNGPNANANVTANANEPGGATESVCATEPVGLTELGGSTEPTSSNYCTVVKKVKKDNVTPENIGEIILCQIPGISSVTAMAIMKEFKTFPHLIEELQRNPQCIENMTIETNGKIRKINKSSLDNIRKYLLQPVTAVDVQT